MTPPPPGMRYSLRHGFVDDGELPVPLTHCPVCKRPRQGIDHTLCGYTDAMPADDLEHATRVRLAGAGFIAIGLYVAFVLLLIGYVMQTAPPPAGPVVTPSTYGWPGPTGGVFAPSEGVR